MTQPRFTIHSTVNDLVRDDLQRAALLESLGLDACCGGSKTLAAACAEKGLDPHAVLSRLVEGNPAAPNSPEPRPEPDGSAASLGELVDHIESTHHVYLKQELPRLKALMEKVRTAHSRNHPELEGLQIALDRLEADLLPHMMKEEKVLFPMVRKLEAGAGPQQFHCGTLKAPIRVMKKEHDRAAGLLEEIRQLSQNYAVPEDGCGSFQSLMEGLKALDADLQTHIHKENDILFPAVLEEEKLYT
ncbi:MAG: iron-sulfur cluster repair di-iron protein [Nitrospinaceae bacterium]|nr:iron-sulfur cluster repair di-iron protein [Nitrospinaceae bacterium]NIR55466.1 iron-sulfur cluster repair di-iron protein [Nitrospinaceae bacterium]NIS85906.1 iron-sulfur cluster repair di-iron protein [Nitrospinaceae bacterium]NIT82750.1 iron-sulfur cluster repair di-iron protein [Nitrospinaceae bacterium]NIU44959.1 iron-sulfur cluster repair di-iron protein [Nitrospinaceae bacterium]